MLHTAKTGTAIIDITAIVINMVFIEDLTQPLTLYGVEW